MKFFEPFRRLPATDRAAREKLMKAWGMDAEVVPLANSPLAGDRDTSAYDREQWRRKLRRVLDRLPDSGGEWDRMMSEAKALGFAPAWVEEVQVEEFTMLVRRAVADRVFTESEHRKLDSARDRIGLTDAEAGAIIDMVIAEVETFFGGAVDEQG